MMKRFVSIWLAVCFLLCLCSCAEGGFQAPLRFYYPRAAYRYDGDNGVIHYEVQEGSSLPSLSDRLSTYLAGPVDPMLVSPFPEDVRLVNLTLDGSDLYLVLSDEFAQLTGLSLSIACVCLTRTCLELTDVQTVHICAETLALDGSSSLILTGQDMLLLDRSSMAAQTGPEQ